MEIREYCSADQKQTIALWRECGLITASNNPEKDIQRKTGDSPALFFVGELNEQIIASCMAGYDGHRGWIYYLAVRPSFRNRGLARRMVQHAEKALLAVGCPKIDLMVRESNTGVLDFYRQIGYQSDPVVVLSKCLYED